NTGNLAKGQAGLEGGHLFIMGAAGPPANHVILTQPTYYKGATHIDTNATLQLGDGTPGNSRAVRVRPNVKNTTLVDGTHSTSRGNGSILTPGTGDGTGTNSIVGVATNLVINNGQLIVNNVVGALDGIAQTTLSHISGVGSVTQMGSAPLTLLGPNTYSGGTTVAAGTLFVGADTSLGTGALTNNGKLATTVTQHAINVVGAFSQGAAGTLSLNAGGTGATAAIDAIKVNARATLGGTLVINAAAEFAPAVGQKFVVVQAAGGVTGTFSSVTVNGGATKFITGYDATTAFVTVSP
ncbi:MAG: hypothetical protein H7X95_02150, partial [Deltaproteobacteria bacterium]|nr:hypothetical protein [Deltaproteobacteria bacterium]